MERGDLWRAQIAAAKRRTSTTTEMIADWLTTDLSGARLVGPSSTLKTMLRRTNEQPMHTYRIQAGLQARRPLLLHAGAIRDRAASRLRRRGHLGPVSRAAAVLSSRRGGLQRMVLGSAAIRQCRARPERLHAPVSRPIDSAGPYGRKCTPRFPVVGREPFAGRAPRSLSPKGLVCSARQSGEPKIDIGLYNYNSFYKL